ncbi:prion-like-(Q/N-rich) domain-bearing protein 25 [Hoplias malabaricus]|uniref:prion-like-(Q/N-rich) domain-bearing protein 25 n=1 Tax=Hoplias malabaricus TaxID=27720 RepID=UPI00346244C2
MQLSCRVLSCNCSMCYSMFMNVNSTVCQANSKYCELRRDDTMNYSAKCATECPVYCNSTTQVNCSVSCCGSETCFNDTMKHLHHNSCMPMSTTQSTITTTTTTATKPVTTTTVVTNGKKCHKISCTGDTCYQGSTNMMLCSTQHYCVLKKTTSGTMVTWTGGCSDDCTKDTVCTSTTTTCSLECCNATTTSSCLKLTGAVNMPGSATRQPFSPILLMTSLLTLWLISKAISA